MAVYAAPPFYYPIFDKERAAQDDYRVSQPWHDWFIKLGAQSGGASTDLTALTASVTALALRVSALELQVASLTSLITEMSTQYKLEYDYVDTATSYRGEAAPGSATSAAVWRISLITVAGDDLTITWAGGTANFNQIWDNRASLSYS